MEEKERYFDGEGNSFTQIGEDAYLQVKDASIGQEKGREAQRIYR